MQQALPQMVAAVLTELERLGVAPTPLPRPASTPRVWWEQAAAGA